MSFVIIVIRKLSWHAADNDEIICIQIEYNEYNVVIIAKICGTFNLNALVIILVHNYVN